MTELLEELEQSVTCIILRLEEARKIRDELNEKTVNG